MRKSKTKKTREKRVKAPKAGTKPAPKAKTELRAEAQEAGIAADARNQVYDSLAAAAVGLGVSKAKLRALKREGAPGFRGSRVYAAELLPWLARGESELDAEAGSVTKDALECRKLRAQAERIEYENNVRYGNFVARVEVAKHLKMFGAEIGQARNEFRNSFPELVLGKAVEEIRAECDKAWDAIFVRFKNHFQQWTI